MMNIKNVLVSVFFVLATFSLSAQEYNGYIVKFHSDKAMDMAMSEMKSLGEVKNLNINFAPFARIHTDAKNLDMIASHPGVAYIEPNWIVSLDHTLEQTESATVSDPRFEDQWGLNNDGDNSGSWWRRGRAGEDVNALEAWTVAQGSEEIIIAVIDTGIDYEHEDLIDNLWFNEEGHNGYNFVNDTPYPMDGNGHGTHCAGIIGASHNDIGVAGMMSRVRMMGIKFLSDSGRGETAHAIKSIEYAIENGAHIMSNSWGGGSYSEALKEVIELANEKGIIFVAAAGNSSANTDQRPMYPAGYDVENIISVGSHDGRGERSSFSNYGAKSVHVFAPGTSILSTVHNNNYRSLSGTSMAAPFVSGAIGLLLEAESNLTPAEVRQRVMDTAVRTSYLGDSVSLSGRLDAYQLVMGLDDDDDDSDEDEDDDDDEDDEA